MDDIKIRAWNKTSNSMILDYAHIGQYGELYVAEFHSSSYGETSPELVLMPFTGLKDMNNVDIIESYIVEFSAFGRTVRGIVEWDIDDGLPGFVIVDTDGSGTIWDFMYDDLIVVGNIYENLDLLEPEKVDK